MSGQCFFPFFKIFQPICSHQIRFEHQVSQFFFSILTITYKFSVFIYLTFSLSIARSSWSVQYPLHSCAAAGNKTEVDILLKKGYPHSQLDSVNCAPIHYAAWWVMVDYSTQYSFTEDSKIIWERKFQNVIRDDRRNLYFHKVFCARSKEKKN